MINENHSLNEKMDFMN